MRLRLLGLIATAALAVVACGGDDGGAQAVDDPELAALGDDYCAIARLIADAPNVLDDPDATDDEKRDVIDRQLGRIERIAEVAPDEIADAQATSLEANRLFAELLRDHDYDVEEAFDASEELPDDQQQRYDSADADIVDHNTAECTGEPDDTEDPDDTADPEGG